MFKANWFKSKIDPRLLVAYNCLTTNAAVTQSQWISFDTFALESPEDSMLWLKLMNYIATTGGDIDHSEDLHLAVCLARAGGARLVRSKQFGYIIKPDYDNGCWTKESYKDIQDIMGEYKEEMLYLLRRIDDLKAPEEFWK